MAETRVNRLNSKPTKALWIGGAIGGIVSGIAMAMVSMMTSFMNGQGFWIPVKLIAATFFGVDALIGGVGVIFAGLMAHMVNSAIFGIIFAYLTKRVNSASLATLAGVGFGLFIWAVMTFTVMPFIDPVMSARVALMPISWFSVHIVFGAVLGLTPYLERVFAPKAQFHNRPAFANS